MKPFRLAIAIATLLALPAAADAADPALADPGVRRLDQAQVEHILDEAAAKREARDAAAGTLGPQVHGMLGFTVGTGGYRSAYGTAVVPLPGAGMAAFSFQTEQGRYYDRYRYQPYGYDRFR